MKMKISTLLMSGAVVAMVSTTEASTPLLKAKEAMPWEQANEIGRAMISPYANASIVSEDFSKFTKGTQDNPDATDLSDAKGNIPESLTNQPGWKGAGVKQAGGTAFIDTYQYKNGEGTGYINTPLMDLSVGGGVFTVSFRARLLDSNVSTDDLAILNLTDGYENSNQASHMQLSPEWKEYKTYLSEGTVNGFFQFYTAAGKWQLDDLEITPGGLLTPIPTGATNYTKGGTSFTANWMAVKGAVSYVVSVAHYQANGSDGKIIYDVENKKAEGTSLDISELTGGAGGSNITYYYRVAAIDADGNSTANCKWTKVRQELQTPKATGATDFTKYFYKANWEAVENASGYDVYNVIEYTAETDGNYAILDTDFGKIIEGKITKPKQFDGSDLDKYIDRVGWTVDEIVFADGHLGLNNKYHAKYPNLFKPAYLMSPATNFSFDGGKATVEFSAIAVDGSVTPKLNIYFVSITDDGRSIILEDTKKQVTLTGENANYSATIEGAPTSGLSAIYLQTEPTYDGTIFFDKLKISQNFKAGQKTEVANQYIQVRDETELLANFELIPEKAGERVAYKVRAYAYDDVTGERYMSPFSQLCYIYKPSGVETAAMEAEAKVFASGGTLNIQNPVKDAIFVFDSVGRLIHANPNAESTQIAIDAKGVYIVKVGTRTFKVMI